MRKGIQETRAERTSRAIVTRRELEGKMAYPNPVLTADHLIEPRFHGSVSRPVFYKLIEMSKTKGIYAEDIIDMCVYCGKKATNKKDYPYDYYCSEKCKKLDEKRIEQLAEQGKHPSEIFLSCAWFREELSK